MGFSQPRRGGASARRLAGAAQALLAAALFGCGIAASLAWQSGLYATTTLAVLVAGWTAAARRGAADRAAPQVAGTAPGGPVADPEMHLLRATLDQVPSPLVTLTQDGRLQAINRSARALFGAESTLTGAPQELVAAIRGAALGQRRTVKLAASGGRAVAVSAATMFGPGGARILAALTDVQAEIQTAEAAALRELLAVLGHEIMNALTPVTSLAGSAHALMVEGTPEGLAQVREALEIILRRAEGLDRFVQGYRALARVPPPILRPVRAGDVLREAAALFDASWGRSGVRLELDVPPTGLVAQMDAGLIGQALLNLLANAAEAALAGGAAPTVRLSAEARAGGVVFSITDNGQGVDPSRRADIFHPFATSKPGGSGIGLSLTRQIANSHGGSLVLEAASCGAGATFSLRIP